MSAGIKQKKSSQFPCFGGNFITVCLCCLVLLFSNYTAQAEDVFVTVKKGATAPAPISRYVLSAIFGMRLTTWPDGSAIRVFVLPDDNRIHTLFCKQILQIFPHQLRTAWDRLVYSGTGQAPEVLGSEQELRTRIAKTPGAIGYLTKENLDDTVAVLPVE